MALNLQPVSVTLSTDDGYPVYDVEIQGTQTYADSLILVNVVFNPSPLDPGPVPANNVFPLTVTVPLPIIPSSA